MKKIGSILVMSGPSGVGKSTVCAIAREKLKNLEFSISCTTRAPRQGENDKVHYYFLSRDEFDRRLENGEFIEHATVFANSYGTLRSEVVDRIAAGRDVILDIDVQGALQIKEHCKIDELLRRSCRFIMIAPPSLGELEKRLRGRKTESEEQLAMRIGKAKNELSFWKEYDYMIVNDNLESAASDLIKLIESLRLATGLINEEIF